MKLKLLSIFRCCDCYFLQKMFLLRQIIEVMAAVREEDIEELANTMYSNTVNLFFKSQNVEASS